MSSRVQSRQFFAWSIHVVVSIFFYYYFSLFFCLLLFYHCSYWLLQLVFFYSFYCVHRVLAGEFPVSLFFFDAYSLSISSHEGIAVCIVINFLVLGSIYLSSSIVHFKNDPEYLTWGTVQVFIPLMRFLMQSLVSRSFFFVLLR